MERLRTIILILIGIEFAFILEIPNYFVKSCIQKSLMQNHSLLLNFVFALPEKYNNCFIDAGKLEVNDSKIQVTFEHLLWPS